MITIIVEGNDSLKNYWMPLCVKYKDDPKYEILFSANFQDAKFENIFFTTYDAIPTYRVMEDLINLKPNQCYTPKWHSYSVAHLEGISCEQCFSVEKSKYQNQNKQKYIEDNDCDVITTGMMYRL